MSLDMNAMLNQSAEDGDVDAMYSILASAPDILKRMDDMAVVDTPLHIAVRAGKAHYALEIASLKPSLAWKLNHLGLSPLHLAMQNGNRQIVIGLAQSDKELVRVKAKGKLTALHYAAQMDDVNYLDEFLYLCPSAIEDRTVRSETAVHVALKNNSNRAFKFLLGWLRRVDKQNILDKVDEDGNTALHIAVSTNQTEVTKLLLRFVDPNSKNNSGLTAMDIFHSQRDLLDPQIGKTLSRAKAISGSELTRRTTADRLSRWFLSLLEFRDKYLGANQKESGNEIRNIILVVATLIATATYQTVLSPPGGFWQDDSGPSPNNTTNIAQGHSSHYAGHMILKTSEALPFFALNSIAFYTSIFTILLVIIGITGYIPLFIATDLLAFSYNHALSKTSPLGGETVFSAMNALIAMPFAMGMIFFFIQV